MAWWESPKSQLGTSKERSFYADQESDISDLPVDPEIVAPGADCLVIETSNVYILDSTYNWSPLGG